jgi:glycosyltransferase involved in cell wall biosynthesis
LHKLEALAGVLGIADAVEFLGFQENPLPYFRQAAAFVLSSHSEGFGNVLVEAMGCGTPIISTDCDHAQRKSLVEAATEAWCRRAARKRWPTHWVPSRNCANGGQQDC